MGSVGVEPVSGAGEIDARRPRACAPSLPRPSAPIPGPIPRRATTPARTPQGWGNRPWISLRQGRAPGPIGPGSESSPRRRSWRGARAPQTSAPEGAMRGHGARLISVGQRAGSARVTAAHAGVGGVVEDGGRPLTGSRSTTLEHGRGQQVRRGECGRRRERLPLPSAQAFSPTGRRLRSGHRSRLPGSGVNSRHGFSRSSRLRPSR